MMEAYFCTKCNKEHQPGRPYSKLHVEFKKQLPPPVVPVVPAAPVVVPQETFMTDAKVPANPVDAVKTVP